MYSAIKLHFIRIIPIILFLKLLFNIDVRAADPPYVRYLNHPWVDSVIKTLTLEKKVAQLIWVAGYSNRDNNHELYLSSLVTETGIGGIVFFQDNVEKQSAMINKLQKASMVPLIIATDGEWGLGMRLKGVEKFPYQMTLGAIKSDSLIYLMGKAVAGQFKRAGIGVNLAPVADVNVNPGNPVINFRSFGEEPERVSRKSLMYMNGMQDNGIIAVAKHFPGHGDTDIDSHEDLPVIRHSRSRLDRVELLPFRGLINAGISGIMPGHLSVPAFDSVLNMPVTISRNALNGVLKNELSFEGIVISDAMNMGGIRKFTSPDNSGIMALAAGIDVLELVENPGQAINEIVKAIGRGDLSAESIDEKCRKVLAAKFWLKQHCGSVIDTANIARDLSSPGVKALIRELYANALTVINNEDNMIPLKKTGELKIATLAINRKDRTLNQKRISSYCPVDNYFIDPSDSAAVSALVKKLAGYDVVIAGVHGLDQRPHHGFGINPGLDDLIERLAADTRLIVTWFGNPYAAGKVPSLKKVDGLIIAYQENEYTEDLSAQLVFGGIGAKGSLPVTIDKTWPRDHGIITTGNIRLQYGFPGNAGMSAEILEKSIDSIVMAGLDRKAYPGCEVIAARWGIVVFHKVYGYKTYEKREAVNEDDLFDLASVTKISSVLPCLMLLETEGRFAPEKTLGEYLPFFKHSDKGDLAINEILTHQAGLKAWIPFWKGTLKKNGMYRRRIFNPTCTRGYPLKVADSLYITARYKRTMLKEIRKSPLSEDKYHYSDLGFIIMPEIISKLSGQEWYDFLTMNIYDKIGAGDIVFNPWKNYPLTRIIPTEYDSLFRRQQLRGTVHDEASAMLGGISGHAGLFATANDLMKLMELFHRSGYYGGEQLIAKEVIKKYTAVQFPEKNNRWGIGFDKPLLNNGDTAPGEAYPTKGASASSFGHSGFTGTFAWVDPDHGLCYIFLSNRVFPSRDNTLIADLDIRTGILQALYDSIIE
jgi:beta-glucosidase-like glycosyl hydrolase/CubicO group peptidase (beta-lactamase class C family)